MKASLLFHPIPYARSLPTDESQFRTVFQSNASVASNLSRQTKSQNPTPNDFQDYLKLLYQYIGAPYRSRWCSPFSPDVVIPSSSIEIEIANTIWNYIAYLHAHIVQLDSSDTENLKTMKPLIASCISCIINLNDIIPRIQSPIFTPQLLTFLQCYNDYLVCCWKYSIILTSPKEEFYPRTSHAALIAIDQCVEQARTLDNFAQSYFLPICQSIQIYLNGQTRYFMGKVALNGQDCGIAIANFKDGLHFLEKPLNITTPYGQTISTAIQLLKKSLEAILQNALQLNKSIYSQLVPAVPPKYPPPIQPTKIEPDTSIILSVVSNSQSYEPSFSSPQTPQAPPAQQFSQPSQPAFKPQFDYSQQDASTLTAPTVQTASAAQTGDGTFPEWEAICLLKQQLIPKIEELQRNPNQVYQQVCSELKEQIKQAMASDNIINNTIEKFKSNQVAKSVVDGLINQASTFYTSVEQRLNKLQLTGK
ncbi:hypothetical protein GPJ56_000303 [Histomonas meleagridis]|uniref:uncharacterized protein n=1 Tax=Histomonas meleagridis TaxID=135588 RepID=UPI00355A0F47|nr:hypothetical protein GPJ56_000303 [Histomonas meleagridis]KAH0806821.1 hypothetical protein GO595_000464 [Histomonas meleagridis]